MHTCLGGGQCTAYSFVCEYALDEQSKSLNVNASFVRVDVKVKLQCDGHRFQQQ